MTKYLCFFLLSSIFLCQELPDWINIDDPDYESVLHDIENIQYHKINIISTPFSLLKRNLYFVPDSLIYYSKYNPELLSPLDLDFMSGFWKHYSQINLHSKIVSTYNIEKYKDTKFDRSFEKTSQHFSFIYRNIHLHISDSKRTFDKYYTNPKFNVGFYLNRINFNVGHLQAKNFNQLVYSNSFGRSFYPYSLNVSYADASTVFSPSKSSATSLFGYSLNYINKYFSAYILSGKHVFYSNVNENSFSSFNSIEPYLKSDKTNESIFLVNLEFKDETHWFSLTHLTIGFDHIFKKIDPYQTIAFKESEYFGAKYTFQNKRFRSQISMGKQLNQGAAFDIEAKLKSGALDTYINLFYYSENYINPKSKGMLNGQSLSKNRKGGVIAIKKKVFKNLSVHIGMKSEEKLIAESKNEFIKPKTKKFLSIEGKVNKFNYLLYVSGYQLSSKKLHVSYHLNNNNKLSSILRLRNNDVATQIQWVYYRLFFGLAHVKTETHWAIYENSFPQEFNFSHFNSNSIRLNTKYLWKFDSFTFGFRYQFIYQKSNTYKSTEYTIEGHKRSSFSFLFDYSL